MTFEDFERGLVAVVVVGFALFYAAGLLWYKPARAEKDVLEWARRALLARADEAFANAVRLRIRRARRGCAGALLGLVASAPVLLVDFGFVGLVGTMAGVTVGHAIGDWSGYVHDRVRLPADSRSTRAYLSRRELWLDAVALVIGMSALALAVAALGAEPDRPEELLAMAVVVVGLAYPAAIVVAQQRVPGLGPRAQSSATAWEEAHRIQMVRDLLSAALRGAVLPVLAVRALIWTMEPATVVPQSVDLLSAVVLFVAMGLSLVQAPLGDRAARLRVSE